MKRSSMKFSTPRAAVAVAMIAILMVGTMAVAFAADLGGIRQTVTLWVQGQPREAVVTVEPSAVDTEIVIEDDEAGEDAGEFTATDSASQYVVEWQDDEGQTHSYIAGGVALEDDGTERPLTMEDIIDTLNAPNVDETEDGRVLLTWYEQVEDITDAFQDGQCRLTMTHDGETVYLLVRPNGDGGYELFCDSEGFEALEDATKAK